MGSSMAFTQPSKGERRPPRAGGEQRPHGEAAEPEDLVCARPSGGGRRGGEISGPGDALIPFQTLSKRTDQYQMDSNKYRLGSNELKNIK